MADTSKWLLLFSRRLQRVSDYNELIEVVVREFKRRTRYQVGWLALYDDAKRMVSVLSGTGVASPEELAPRNMVEFPYDDDPLLELIRSSVGPVVIEDAPNDPRVRQDRVAAVGNQTIINIPLLADEKNIGSLGTGTFGEQGTLPPTSDELNYMTAMASQVSVVLGRLREREQRESLEIQLRHAQRLDAMGRLAGGVAHDFNNLLSVILGNAELASADGELSEDLSRYLSDIEAAALRASQLTRQLLAFSRRQLVRTQALSLNELLTTLLPMLERLIPERIIVEFLPGGAEATVLADPGQLEQVVVNLMVNARDAIGDHGRIVVETENVFIDEAYRRTNPWAKIGRFVLLTVTDTGSGMSEEIRDQIFEPFFTTKNADEGTGLGLSVAFGIVDQHGGVIRSYSEEGVGTSFKVYLPIAERPASVIGTKIERPTAGGDEYILLVEDDERVRRVVRSMLVQAGYDVTTVEDGQQALEMLQRDGLHFDLVVSDIVMPNVGGVALWQAARDLKKTTPFVIMSGYAAGGLHADFSEEDQVVILTKPFRSKDLLTAVREQLDG